jgi:hypothetical protein
MIFLIKLQGIFTLSTHIDFHHMCTRYVLLILLLGTP